MKPLAKCLVLAAVFAAGARPTEAATITIDATSRGYYASSFLGSGGNGGGAANEYFVGLSCGLVCAEFRNWFTFDLTSVAGTVVSATFEISQPINGYLGDVTGSHSYALFDVDSGNIGSLGGPYSNPVFLDIGSGTTYGSRSFSVADNGTLVPMGLNAAAVTAINNALGSQFAIGGILTVLDGALFNGSTGAANLSRLVIETRDPGGPAPVPEPATLLLVGGGLAAAIRRRSRRGR